MDMGMGTMPWVRGTEPDRNMGRVGVWDHGCGYRYGYYKSANLR